jgi:hypothetical protein
VHGIRLASAIFAGELTWYAPYNASLSNIPYKGRHDLDCATCVSLPTTRNRPKCVDMNCPSRETTLLLYWRAQNKDNEQKASYMAIMFKLYIKALYAEFAFLRS